MLKDTSGINLQGKIFANPTYIPVLDCADGKVTKVSLIYGRNGSGKSTIAKAFRQLSGEKIPTIQKAEVWNKERTIQTLSENEKKSIFVFDEDFVSDNIRIEGNGLGSIIMLGEQADLTDKIADATEALKAAGEVTQAKETALNEYKDSSNIKAPKYYLNKILSALKQDDGWAGRDRLIKGHRQNARVLDDTYKQFIKTPPELSRDELIIEYSKKMKELEVAKNGTSKITVAVPTLPEMYKKYTIALAGKLLKEKIEKPDLSEREKYLLSLVSEGRSDELQDRIRYFHNGGVTYCPYCLQDVTEDYKNDLISKIQKVLSDDVKKHQGQLKALCISECILTLDAYVSLDGYQTCIDLIELLNSKIKGNNSLLQKKINDVFTPVDEEMLDVSETISQLITALAALESARTIFNKKVVDTRPIVNALAGLNDQIAYYEVVDLASQLDRQNAAMAIAQKEYDDSLADQRKKKELLDELDAQRKRIDIAIDVINNSLKYIFFAEDRLSISRYGDIYALLSHGKPVQPKEISVGERNIIGLSYFFTKIMQGKNPETVYSDEHLIIIDDPVSSYDLENKVGILSFLKYKMSQFLSGNMDSRIVITTHDLMTFFDLEKICKELQTEWDQKYGNKKTKYILYELKNGQTSSFEYKKRHEYTELLKQIYEYAQGGAADYDLVIGNIMRQALEAFSTFEYRKGIDGVSIDDSILNASGMCLEHKSYFKNLMYRIVLNGGSHREDQARNLEIDFLALISEPEKRRTAKEILCFIYLLNKPHLLAHLGNVTSVLDQWCDEIKGRAAVI